MTDTLANSYIHLTSASAGAAAELAAEKKTEKYADLATNYIFTSVAFETLGPMNEEGSELIQNIGKRLPSVTGDKREPAFLRQRLSIAYRDIMRYVSGALSSRTSASMKTVLNYYYYFILLLFFKLYFIILLDFNILKYLYFITFIFIYL